jgi:circadian clock protein KaiC
LESFSADSLAPARSDKQSMGVPGLDRMMRGGVRSGTTTMVLGPTGVGKTMLGYRFLAASNPDEKGVLFSFYETPEKAIAKGDGVGLGLAARMDARELELCWQSPVEISLDGIGGRILDIIERTGATRLFIDGFDALQNAAAYPDRVNQFFAALCRELHARGVTTLHSAELRAIFSPQIEAPVRGISPLLENLILLRFVEFEARVRRAISVLKMRDSDFDSTLREFVIDDDGLRVTGGFAEAEAVLTGTPHAAPDTDAPEAPTAARKTGKRGAKARKRRRR